jgi:hypothetical protein
MQTGSDKQSTNQAVENDQRTTENGVMNSIKIDRRLDRNYTLFQR